MSLSLTTVLGVRIVLCHNYYREAGGEDRVFEDESDLLTLRGHKVHQFVRRNTEFSGLQTIAVAAGTVWNRSSASALGDLVREQRADVVHFHNWLPQISQGAFYAARRAGAAVVRTMHNYRSTCAQGVLFRDGAVCEECVGASVGWPAIAHGCYRGSRMATIPVVAALAAHRALRTDVRAVDATIVLTEFARSKMIAAGLPADRLHVKPNFVVPDPGPRPGNGGYFIYVGRLDESKGILTLLDAWQTMQSPPLLKVAGTGPVGKAVEAAAAKNSQIEYLGRVPAAEIADIVGDASYTIMPTLNYEGFPKVIVESFAVGTPVIASDLGSVGEIIDPKRTGYCFVAGDARSLAQSVSETLLDVTPNRMRAEVRREYVSRYGIDRNYDRLMDIYAQAIELRRAG